MKNTVYLLIVLSMGSVGIACKTGQVEGTIVERKVVEKEKDSLRLPPLSIFTESRMWEFPYKQKNLHDPLEENDINALYAYFMNPYDIQEDEANEILELISREQPEELCVFLQEATHAAIPYMFYGLRHLYEKEKWNEEDMRVGSKVSELLSNIFQENEIFICCEDQDSFRAGLKNLSSWFNEMCSDNRILAKMIITRDDGPYIGQDIENKPTIEAREIGSAELSKEDGKLVLLKTKLESNPVIIRYIRPDGSIGWQKRLHADSKSDVEYDIDDAGFAGVKDTGKSYKELKGFGYKVYIWVDWTWGCEFGHLYLDKDCNMRFFFLGW